MRLRALLPFFAFWFLAISTLSAQHWPEPTQARLATVAHLAALTQSDFKTLSAQAQSGDPEAQYWLALAYDQGRLVPKDSMQFESWLFKSAEQGYAPAEEIAGRMCLSGVHRDPRKAQMWLRRAALHGDSEAQFWLGAAYEQGWIARRPGSATTTLVIGARFGHCFATRTVLSLARSELALALPGQ